MSTNGITEQFRHYFGINVTQVIVEIRTTLVVVVRLLCGRAVVVPVGVVAIIMFRIVAQRRY